MAYTARRVRSCGVSRLGMAASASIMPHLGQMSVWLSTRDSAGGSSYARPHSGQMCGCSFMLPLLPAKLIQPVAG
ncbi:hypothetical protein [uncultured Mitsuokella sp.]|uniref:hypothetical protein n=1 Tax=uncultured Mitsuokella sp. TaxID=453120 RepID=UPI002596013F|nr:hypothetical protein [uncultured Mitsuokella sp.]